MSKPIPRETAFPRVKHTSTPGSSAVRVANEVANGRRLRTGTGCRAHVPEHRSQVQPRSGHVRLPTAHLECVGQVRRVLRSPARDKPIVLDERGFRLRPTGRASRLAGLVEAEARRLLAARLGDAQLVTAVSLSIWRRSLRA